MFDFSVTRLARDMALDKDKTLSSIMGEVAQPPNVPEDVNSKFRTASHQICLTVF